jgi:TolB protein
LTGLAWTGDSRLVFTSSTNGTPGIWITNVDGTGPAPLTSDPDSDESPCVTRDDRYIVFSSSRGGSSSIWRMGLAGDNVTRLTTGGVDLWPLCSPDSRTVVYTSVGSTWGTFTVPIDGGSPTKEGQ